MYNDAEHARLIAQLAERLFLRPVDQGLLAAGARGSVVRYQYVPAAAIEVDAIDLPTTCDQRSAAPNGPLGAPSRARTYDLRI
ncbi:MAG: hypothetical protein LLG14_12920, partial [Nocardiaceae bacterium]|nr:hypothetical protein [Nocardiaceae bacterium]